jgi:hypothetical protein
VRQKETSVETCFQCGHDVDRRDEIEVELEVDGLVVVCSDSCKDALLEEEVAGE